MSYSPNAKSRAILERAWEHIQSVPYSVSLRWLFYRLYQEGIYTDKDDYKAKLSPLLSKARKRFYKDWTPDTLVDDTRTITTWGAGSIDEQDFLNDVATNTYCILNKLQTQKAIVAVLFEAKAMAGQFRHYLPHAAIRFPFGGDVSIPAKWEVAERLARRWREYRVPIHVFYFGDYDLKGLDIEKAAIGRHSPLGQADHK